MPELSSVPSFLEGIYIALNAVPDARLILDAPVGCLFKSERLGLNHDLASTLFDALGQHRVVPTIEHPQQLVSGTETTLRGMIRRVVEQSRPSMVFLSEVTAVQLAGNDGNAIATEMSQDLGVPVSYIRPENLEGDFLDGYEALLNALVETAGVSADTGAGLPPNTVTIVGYMPDRLEADHQANFEELRRLIEAAGLSCAGILLDGSPSENLARAARAQLLVAFPLGRDAARKIARRSGARVLELDLPIGLDGTIRFIETLAREAGSLEQAHQTIETALRTMVPVLDRVREQFLSGRHVAIAATPDLLPGLLGFVAELGMACPLVGVRCRSEHRVGQVREVLDRLHPRAEALWDYPRSRFRKALERLHADRPIDVVVGSTSEYHASTTIGAGFFELGYPSFRTHALTPRPTLGFAGVMRLVEDLVNAVLRRTERD